MHTMRRRSVSPLALTLALLGSLCSQAAHAAAVCTSVSDATSTWSGSTADATITAKWYPLGPTCDAACSANPNSCVFGCVLCSSDSTSAVGIVQEACTVLNGTSTVLTPGSVVTIVGKARIRTVPLSGAEFRSCSTVTLVSLAAPSPAPPPPAASSWDGTVRLMGPVVQVSWKLFSANSSITFFVQALTDAFPIVGLSLGTNMVRNSLANTSGVPAYMAWFDAAGVGHVVSYMMTGLNEAAVVPTGEQLYNIRVMRTNGRLSFQFNRRLQGGGNPPVWSLDGVTPVPLQFTLYNTWASADNVSVPLHSDMHIVRPRGYATIQLAAASPSALPSPPPAFAPAPAPGAVAPTPAAAPAPATAPTPMTPMSVPRNIKAHAVCMALAWGLFFPCSALVARHCKPLGAKTFLHLHVGLNALGGLALIIGFACIRAYVSGDDNHHYTSIHSRIGLFIFVVWWLQPLNGVLRPKHEPGVPPSQMRRYWELVHKSFGRALMALALITVVMGMVLLRSAGASHAAVGGGIAAWVLWCVFALGGGVFYLERNAAKWMPPSAAGDGAQGLLDDSMELDHHVAVGSDEPAGQMKSAPTASPVQSEL
jgi:Eukaryotic cytochrome b561